MVNSAITKWVKETPWDAAVFGMPTWEVISYSEEALQAAESLTGHVSIKVQPTAPKGLLHKFGYYYCDTLIQPYCLAGKLPCWVKEDLEIKRQFDASKMLEICHGAFINGRYHKDFGLEARLADERYNRWLQQLIDKKQVYGLFNVNELAGFIAYEGNQLILHAIGEKFRGRGYAKYWWSLAAQDLISQGHSEVCSSISAGNIAVLNLYSSMGFSFKNPVDVYHKVLSLQ